MPPERLRDIVPEYHSGNPLVRWVFRRRVDLALELARLDGADSMDILDLGCGEGVLLRAIGERFPAHRMTGADFHPDVERLELPQVRALRVDFMRENPFPEAAFDRVFCMDVLEHVEDLSRPLALIRRALKPGGRFVISAPTENFAHQFSRFLIKGTFSEKAGPAASPHYHKADTLCAAINKHNFMLEEVRSIPLPGPLALNQVCSFI
ncbi:MAG: class I SAM-dependent methyltransferase [Elusimicrobiota bacterium]